MKAIVGVIAAAGALGAVAWASGGEVLTRFDRSAYLMGTRVDLSVWAASRTSGHAWLERALQALERTEAELSTWRDESAISAVNRAPLGVAWFLTPSQCALLGALAEWRQASNGAFDPAIGALTGAWDIHGEGRIPSPREVEQALAASGFSQLNFDRSRCEVTRRVDVTIDVGAFGKGEALDRASKAAVDDRHLPWMINLGGQISAGGVPPAGDGWRLSIARPDDRSRPHLDVLMPAGSLSTSAGSERDLIVAGQRVGHHLDPRTGHPARFRGSVTVWHPSGLVADLLSTALFVMGPAEGVSWAAAKGVAACYLEVDAATGQVRSVMTTSFRSLVTAVRTARVS